MQQQFQKKVDKYELNKKQQQKLQNMFEASLVSNYFQSVAPTEYMSKMTAKHYSEKITTNLDVLINEGVLEISREKKTVDQLMDEVKIKQEEIKAEQIKIKKELIQNELRELKRQTSITKSNSEQKLAAGNLVLTKQDHKKLIQKMKKSRIERDQKHQQFLEKIQQKQKQQQQLQRLKKEQQKKQQMRLKRETILQNLQKHKKQHQQHLKIERESKQKIKQIQHHKFVYQQIEQKYQKSVVLPILQQKKKKLKQLRQYKTLDIQQIKEHEKNYLQLKSFQQTKRSQVKQQWNYNPPPKSERLESILQEEKLQRVTKEQEKKRALQQRLQRQQNFASYLKQNFVPKKDPAKEDQIKIRIQKSRVVKPQTGDFREIGLTYLEEAKKKRRILKKIQERPETQQKAVNLTFATATQTKQMRAKSNTDYHTLDRHRDQHYQRIRRRNLQKIAKQEDIPQAERIKQLKHQAQKINEKMMLKQKELKYKKDMKLKEDTLELLLSSIQAKIGIIQMYQ